MARLPGPNLTRGKGGIGSHYSDADWIRALKHGLRRDGSPLVVMPSQWFSELTASDMAAMIAYLKTVPPVDRELPSLRVGPMGRLLVMSDPKLIPAQLIDHAKPLVAAAPVELVARGEQLAGIAGCRSCHLADLTGGGGPPPGSANITPVGIGAWTKEDFFRTLRTGRTPDNRTLSESMPRALGNMSDEELDAIWAYLKTVPPKDARYATTRLRVSPSGSTWWPTGSRRRSCVAISRRRPRGRGSSCWAATSRARARSTPP